MRERALDVKLLAFAAGLSGNAVRTAAHNALIIAEVLRRSLESAHQYRSLLLGPAQPNGSSAATRTAMASSGSTSRRTST
jgi:hypothetical protein